jgi:hypothetical protein
MKPVQSSAATESWRDILIAKRGGKGDKQNKGRGRTRRRKIMREKENRRPGGHDDFVSLLPVVEDGLAAGVAVEEARALHRPVRDDRQLVHHREGLALGELLEVPGQVVDAVRRRELNEERTGERREEIQNERTERDQQERKRGTESAYELVDVVNGLGESAADDRLAGLLLR